MKESALSSLALDKMARISELLSTGRTRRRLMDLGFIPGTCVVALFRGPKGDPTAYCVRGAVIALRKEDADQIMITCDI